MPTFFENFIVVLITSSAFGLGLMTKFGPKALIPAGLSGLTVLLIVSCVRCLISRAEKKDEKERKEKGYCSC